MSEPTPFRELSEEELKRLTPEEKLAYLAAAFKRSAKANGTQPPAEPPSAEPAASQESKPDAK